MKFKLGNKIIMNKKADIEYGYHYTGTGSMGKIIGIRRKTYYPFGEILNVEFYKLTGIGYKSKIWEVDGDACDLLIDAEEYTQLLNGVLKCQKKEDT